MRSAEVYVGLGVYTRPWLEKFVTSNVQRKAWNVGEIYYLRNHGAEDQKGVIKTILGLFCVYLRSTRGI